MSKGSSIGILNNDDMTKEEMTENIEKAIKMCNKLMDQYDNNREITDIDLCYIVETLRGIKDGRHCYECGIENFENGYVIYDGEEYYCSSKCLYTNYSEDEYQRMYEEGIAHWTQWDD